MSEYNTYLQTTAAISSAIAAIAAVCVARSTFAFQRNSLLKKVIIEQIMKLLNQLYYLRSLTVQPVLSVADGDFSEFAQQISEIRVSVIALESMVSAPASADVKRVRDVVYSLREVNVFAQNHKTPNVTLNAQLGDAISALHNIYRTEIKMNMKKILPLVAFAVLVLAPYATQGQPASKPKHISYKEASAFELSLLARKSNVPKAPEKLYIQPANKSEACRLPTKIARPLDGPRFRDYWDGECKNGFAFGLGRDIAISDTYHVEEITIYDGMGDHSSQPSVFYDYVNNVVSYAVDGSEFPAETFLDERMVSSVSGFNAYQKLTVVDELGNEFIVLTSSFQPVRVFMNTTIDNAIGYKFTDNSTTPVTDQNAATFAAEIVDPKSNKVGVAVVRYANGAVQQFKVSDGKNEIVSFPTAYTDHLQTKYQEVVNVTSQANANLQRAQQIEREYLFKACNGKSSIKGLDNSDYTKICTWRDQFKEPYATASANYQRQLESLKQQAITAEQQRQIQQQIALQQQMLQQQQNQQVLQGVNSWKPQAQPVTPPNGYSWQAPQVQPITPPNGNQVICHTIGSITICR